MTSVARNCVLAGLALLLSPMSAHGQTGQCAPSTADAYLEANSVRARIPTNGNLFWAGSPSVYEVPRGSGQHAMFSASLWVAGDVEGAFRIAGSAFGPYEYWSGPHAKLLSSADCSQFDRIWTISQSDLRDLDAGYPPSESIRTWPWEHGAPVVDADGVPDNYNLAGGDRPRVLGSQSVFWIMSDSGNRHEYFRTPPLGIEVHATAFAASSDNPDLDNTTFYHYRIINKSSKPIRNGFAGMHVDPDLGHPWDDYTGVDTSLGLVYTYNAYDFDNDPDRGYGAAPPAIGIKLIHTPLAASSAGDPTGSGSDPNEQVRLHSFVSYVKGAGRTTGQPGSAPDAENYIHGVWLDGQPITEGAWGRNPDAPATRFTFPARPPGFWSEMNVDGAGTMNSNTDKQFVFSVGPFDLDAGAEDVFTVAVIWARGHDHLDSLDELFAAAERLDDLNLAEVKASPVPTLAPGGFRPGHGAAHQPLDTVLGWDRLQGSRTLEYEVEITETATGVTQVATVLVPEFVPALDPGSQYSWRVRAQVDRDPGPWSMAQTFSTGTQDYSRNPTGIRKFDVVANASGPLDPPVQAEVGLIRPGNPDSTQQVGPGRWVFHYSHEEEPWDPERSWDNFVRHVVEPASWDILPDDIELRFTGGSVNYDSSTEGQAGDLPFEVWNVGSDTPEDGSDDFRLLVISGDPEGDGWGLRAVDHHVSGGRDDPQTDPFSIYQPLNTSAGDAGYREWESRILSGADPSVVRGPLILKDLILVSVDGGRTDQGVFNQARPELGTVFRITTDPVPPPTPTAPVSGVEIAGRSATFHWRAFRDDPVQFSIYRHVRYGDWSFATDAGSGLTVDLPGKGVYYWSVRDVVGQSSELQLLAVEVLIADVDIPIETGDTSILEPPFPNPTSQSSTISFTLERPETVRLALIDMLGREVALLLSGSRAAGRHAAFLDLAGVSTGVYLVKLEALSGTHSRLLQVVR